MKNKELFNRTVAVLVKAYQNDTLQHGSCCACAVGNLVAAAKGVKIISKSRWEGDDQPSWGFVHRTTTDDKQLFFRGLNQRIEKGMEEIKLTGYEYHETAKIELAFETADKGNNKEDRMFNGLMAVVDCLMLIHEANAEEVQEAKLLFVKL